MDKNLIRPKIGLGVILINYDSKRILIGKRKGSHGEGTWSFPGGHLEYFETFTNCAKREVLEEVGLGEPLNYEFIENRPSLITNDFFVNENKHYVTLYLQARYICGKVQNREPQKCEKWDWLKWDEIQKTQNLFLPVRNLIRQGYNPFN